MITYYKKDTKVLQEVKTLAESDWVNISAPFNQAEFEDISMALDIPLDFLTDSTDIDERSRYEREDDILLIVVNTPMLQEDVISNGAIYVTIPIGIILTRDHIITITSNDNPIIQKFIDGRIRNFQPNIMSLFVLQIFEQTVYLFLTCLKKLNYQRNNIEQTVLKNSDNKGLQRLLGIEKSLVYFVTALSSNELLKMKLKRANLLRTADNEFQTELLEDIIIDNSQALEMANTYSNILRGTMDALASIISNNLNIVMKRLTLITIILMVPTLIASFFGMNLVNSYENHPYMFPGVIISSIIASLLLAWVFRKIRLF